MTLIGCGGIGSILGLCASKLGIRRITVYDDDSIENHNFSNQMYRLSDLNRPKVEALADVCKDFAGCDVDARKEKVTSDHIFTGLVVSGVDSMKARQEIWKAVHNNPRVPMYIEARTGGETLRLHAVRPCDPDDSAWYEKKLYSDEQALDLPCTGQAIIYNLFVVAGFMGRHIAKCVRGEWVPKEIVFNVNHLDLIVPDKSKRVRRG